MEPATPVEAASKKLALDDLTKEEIIDKYHNALVLLKKAKQTKDMIVKENVGLKEQLSQVEKHKVATDEIIENLTQQKLTLVTTLEELKYQKKVLNDKLLSCESKLYEAECKISELDTANQSYKRQVNRLTDENEQLITHLDGLERKMEELKEAGIQQQQQLLELEKANADLLETSTHGADDKKTSQIQEQVVELQRMLNISLEEIKNLKTEVAKKEQEMACAVKDLNSGAVNDELKKTKDTVEALKEEVIEKTKENQVVIEELEKSKLEVANLNKKVEEMIGNENKMQSQFEIEKLKDDLKNANDKLAKIQLSSDATLELQSANEKLKEKLKLYHTKMIKFAGDIKMLKANKTEILDHFKSYTQQVEVWKKQLNELSQKLLQNISNCEMEKIELQKENQTYKSSLENLEKELKTLKNERAALESDMESSYTEQIEIHRSENKLLKENINKLTKELTECTEMLNKFKKELEECNDELKRTSEELTETKIKQDLLENEKFDLINELRKHQESNSQLSEENSTLKEENVKQATENDRLNKESVEFNKVSGKLEEELVKLKEENVLLTEEIRKVTKQCDVQNENAAKFKQEVTQLFEENTKLKEESFTLTKERNQLIEEKTELEEKRIEMAEENKVLLDQLNEQQKVLKEKTAHLENALQSQKEFDCAMEEAVERQMKTELKLEEANKALENLKRTDVELEKKTAEEIQKLVQESKAFSEECDILREKLQEFEKVKSQVYDAGIQTIDGALYDENNYEERIALLARENHELLAEMNEMNQALKERGETISKQQIYCEELLKKAQAFESQCSKHQEALKEKESQINGLKNEVLELKDHSLKMEGSFDVENNELKKKDDTITQLQNEIQSLRDKFNSNVEAPHDNSYAESESMSTSTVSRVEDINRFKDLEGSWEERYSKLRALAVKQKGKIRDLAADLTREQNEKVELQQKFTNTLKTVQSLQAQCDKLHDDLDTSKMECNSYIKKLDTIALDITKDKRLLANNEETIAKLTLEVENFNKERTNTETWKKQVSVKVQALKKELEANAVLKRDFENQIKQLNSDVEAKEKALKAEMEKHNQTRSSLVESNNECKKQTVLNLEMQDYERSMKDLSQKLEKKQDMITKLKGQLDTQKSTLNSLKEQNALLEEQMKTGEKELEGANSEINILKSKIAEFDAQLLEKDSTIQTFMESLEDVRSENEELSTQLTTIIAEHQKVNSSLKVEKEHLRSQNLGLEQRLREIQDYMKLKEDELCNVQSEYQGYKVRAQSVLRQNQTRDIGLEEKLTEEAESLKAQVGILNSEIAELKSLIEKLEFENQTFATEKEKMGQEFLEVNSELEDCRNQLDQLLKKHQQTLGEHAETVRGLKIHAETLSQCYRQQIGEQEVRHNREIIELQSKVAKNTSPPEIPPLLLPTMPREEGEGSESVESSATSIHPIPLERLLSVSSDQEIGIIKKQLMENESKVTHLTALLADTEQDLVKHVQMNKLLKEEIRRQQRSVEREQHAENLEYLKNVMFKFITLSNGDERTRLVPVLTTILKLSPEETQKLNLVAKSDKGWSTYLPLWTSASKPQ